MVGRSYATSIGSPTPSDVMQECKARGAERIFNTMVKWEDISKRKKITNAKCNDV